MSGSQQNMVLKLCACRAALAGGIVSGLAFGLLGVVTLFTETYGHRMVGVIGNVLCGYVPNSRSGVAWGLLWGFVAGFIGMLLIVGLYNCLCGCGSCCRKASAEGDAAEQ